jgi:hypothetical protein
MADEDCTHLFVHYRFTQQVWYQVRLWSNANFPIPDDAYQSTEEWWIKARKVAPKNLRRDFDTAVILVHWRIWKERNGRIFRQEINTADRVFELIVEDLRAWRAAGCINAL